MALEGRAAWLVPFVAGAPADPACARERAEAARALGRLHRAGADLAVARPPHRPPLARLAWPPAAVPAQLEEWAAEIAEARAWAIAWVAWLAAQRPLPAGLVHGDLFPGNVLVAQGRVAAVLDWEEARLDWVSWDLAIAVGTFCADGDDVDRDAEREFVAAYRRAGGTARRQDDDLVRPLVRVKRILEVLRAPRTAVRSGISST